jgi:glucose-1-phosphate thymidylyltransferase
LEAAREPELIWDGQAVLAAGRETSVAQNEREQLVLLNARLVPAQRLLTGVRALVNDSRDCMLTRNGTLLAAKISGPRAEAVPWGTTEPQAWFALLQGAGIAERSAEHWQIFDDPHDVVRYHAEHMAENLAARLTDGYVQPRDGFYTAENVTVGEHVVVDARRGPVFIEHDAAIGPFTLLRGPLLIGAGARINEHSALKDGTCIGHTCKVGGEVECSTLEPYSNKQHHGFLGHSHVGSWVNLGAGTSNSDLKNTYGQVNMQYHGEKVATGMQFLGCMIGDYAKTAINTSIFTGKIIGACSMVYGFVTGNVPSFVNYARSFGQVTEAPVEVMIATQKRMFERRGKTQSQGDVELLRQMYELTRAERENFGETLVSEPLSW